MITIISKGLTVCALTEEIAARRASNLSSVWAQIRTEIVLADGAAFL
jgi:hypothetical protein